MCVCVCVLDCFLLAHVRGLRAYVRAGAREYVRVLASMHVRFSGRARVRAGERAGAYISKVTYIHANYQTKNYYNHNNLQRQKVV